MRKYLIFQLFAMLVITGCASQSGDLTPPENPDMAESDNPYHITIEEALGNLDDYFAANNEGKTRSNMLLPKVKDVTAIRDYRRATRNASAGANDTAALLYVANFDDAQGFAILSADKRIRSLILAVTEEGNIAGRSTALVNHSNRVLFSEFPLAGPGFFTDTIEGETETFINPNTIDFTTIEANDTLIGNLDVAEYTPLNSNINSRITLKIQTEVMIMESSLKYAEDCIKHSGLPGINDNNISSNLIVYPGYDEPGGGIHHIPETDIVIVGPLLRKFKDWEQSPYLNIYFPKRFSFSDFKRVRVPTGCYPLALAKIMAYHLHPSVYFYNGHIFDWSIIKNYKYGQSKETALFLKAIAEGCDALYFGDGTFVFPFKARQFMTSVGYQSVENKEYKFDIVKQMIDTNRPMAICAYPAKGIFSGHAWNIDGYRTSRRGDMDIKMVHCDFGWGGDYNGYYVNGIFDLKSSDNLYDGDGVHSGNRNNYKHFLRIMSYNVSD